VNFYTGPTPPLTIGMPVYNGERYLSQALDALLVQTYGDFTLIVSDNASTDGTEEICREYAAADQRISYSRLDKNYGAARNFNRVFKLNRSPLFKFATHDDVCAPQMIEQCMAYLANAPQDVALCFPTTIGIDANGQEIRRFVEKLEIHQKLPHERLRHFLSNYHLTNCLYGVLRASTYGSTRLLQAFDSADIVLLAELALRGRFHKLSEPLFQRRFHAEMSIHANRSATARARWFDTSKRSKHYLPRVRVLEELFRAVNNTPLDATERRRCYRAIITTWLPRTFKSAVAEKLPRSYVRSRRARRLNAARG